MILSVQLNMSSDINERLLYFAGEAGFGAVDCSLQDMKKRHCLFNGDDYMTHVLRLKRVCDANNLFFNQAHAPFGMPSSDSDIYENKILPRSIEIAAALGAEIIIVHPIHNIDYSENKELLKKLNFDFYNRVLPYAEKYNIKIAVENMFQREAGSKKIIPSVCSAPAEFKNYMDMLDRKYFVACLDIGHCGLTGTNAVEAIHTLGKERIKALHIHDNDFVDDLHTLPGLGKNDWNSIIKALADIGYEGDFTLEANKFLNHYEPDFLPVAIKYMHDTGRYLIDKFEGFKKSAADKA